MVITSHARARFDYDILETFEAGIELKGFEVKAIKNGRINISGAIVLVRGGEVWLVNADIPPYQPKNAPKSYEPTRPRRLLLRRFEIDRLLGFANEKGLTIMPLKVYTKGRNLKLELGVGKLRKKHDKREVIRKREAIREMRRVRK